MDRLTLTPAASLTAKRLSQLLNQAYADYFVPVRLDPFQFKLMCDDMDVDLERSVVAIQGGIPSRAPGEIPVGLALLSCRGIQGWISGVGVHPIWRRRGIARQMIRWIQSVAQQDGLDRLRLEVLEQNGAAILLYEGLGFVKIRDLLVLTFEPGWAALKQPAHDVSAEPPSRLLRAHQRFHEVDPSWQRDLSSLTHRAGRLLGMSLREGPDLAGYLLYQPQSDAYAILDLAVDPAHPRRLQVAELLLSALHSTRPDFGGHTVNVPADDPLLPAYMAVGYRVWQRQHEMVWPVDEVT